LETSPGTTEVSVEQKAHVLEVVVERTTGPAGLRSAPDIWVWISALDVGWDVGAGEEPDLDLVAVPVKTVHTTASCVEAVAVRLGRGAEDGAAVVAAADSAVRVRSRLAELTVGCFDCNVTAWRGVDAGLGLLLVVDALHDVDLATCWPGSITVHPECWP